MNRVFNTKPMYPVLDDTDEDFARERSMDFAVMFVKSINNEKGEGVDFLAAFLLRFEPANLEWAIGYCREFLNSRNPEKIVIYALAQSCMNANGWDLL